VIGLKPIFTGSRMALKFAIVIDLMIIVFLYILI